MRKVSVLVCAAIAVVLPTMVLPAVPVRATAAPAPPPATGAPPRAGAPARPASPRVVTPALTNLSLGNAGVPTGRRVSTGEPDAPATRLAARELTVARPSGQRFAAVGVSWALDDSVGDVRVELRHRSGAGAWSAWSRLDKSDSDVDTTPKGEVRRGGTDPVWTGTSTGVEARVVPESGTPPRDVRLTLIDPGTSPADATPLATAAGDASTGTLPRPAIYTRAQWGADPRLMTWDPEYSSSIKAGFLHHTAGPNDYAAADVPAILRSIYAFHSQTRGWGDIGYNFLVDRFGRAWEGRYGGMDTAVIGAHTGGFNRYTFGVSMMGTFGTTAVPAATTAAVSAVFAWKLSRWTLDPYGTARLTSAGGGTSRYPAGTTVTKSVISGHRDVGNTSCPGDRGYATLPTVRAQVKARLAAAPPGPALVSPVITPTTVSYAAASGPRITARLTGSTAWSARISSDCPGGVVRTLAGTGSAVDVRWDLRDGDGVQVRPGAYRIRLAPTADGTGGTYSARVTVTPPTGTAPIRAGSLPPAGPAGFVPVAPYRVLDTRGTTGGAGAMPLGGGRRVDVPVLGGGGVPPLGVTAVVVSATGLCPTAETPLTLWPAGLARPATSSLTVNPGGSAALALVRVGAGGRVSVAAGGGSVDAALDVVGYLPARGGVAYHAIPAARIFDVRMSPGETRTLGVPTLPSGSAGVLANVAVVGPAAAGHIRVWPAGRPRPQAASLTFAAGPPASDRVTSGVSADGAVAVHNDSPAAVRVVVDLSGWWGGTAGMRFTALAPARIRAGALPAATDVSVPVTGRAGVPAGAAAVVATLSGRSSTRTWFVGWPSGARPGTADLHAEANRWEATLAVFPIGPDGRIRLRNAAGAGTAVLDVVGYYR